MIIVSIQNDETLRNWEKSWEEYCYILCHF